MGFKQWLGEYVAQTGLFHRDRADSPVPTGEQYPLPIMRASVAKSVTVAAGATVSSAVDTAGAGAMALVCLTPVADFISYFKVSSSETGPYYDLYHGGSIRFYARIRPGKAQSLFDFRDLLSPWRFVKFELETAAATPMVIEVHMK